MKNLSLFTLLLTLLAVQLGVAQTFHAIIVADTENANKEFATICTIDYKRISEEIKVMADSIGYQLKTYPATGSDFTPSRVRSVANNIQLKENDICFFYYSGAAFCDADEPDKERNRSFRMGKDRKEILSTKEIFPVLQAKKARLNVFLVDGCATIRQISVRGVNRGVAKHKVYQSLFSVKGTILLFSSQCPEYSYGDTRIGSIFTYSFISGIDYFIQSASQSLSWRTLFNWVHDTTVMYVKTTTLRNQHPVCFESLSAVRP